MTCMSMTMMPVSMMVIFLFLIFYSMSMSMAHNCFIIDALLIKSRIFFRNFIGSLRPLECRAGVPMTMSMVMIMRMAMAVSMAMVTRKHNRDENEDGENGPAVESHGVRRCHLSLVEVNQAM